MGVSTPTACRPSQMSGAGAPSRIGPLLAFVALVFALVAAPSPALAKTDLGEPTLTEAQAAIVTDQEGTVLFSKNPDAEINMASITKIMTAVVALESGVDLDATYELHDVTLAENAMAAGYHAGMTSTLRDLLRAMLVYSANDAASEVAIAVSGSEEAFVQKMNERAQEMGLSHTHFENPHGLDAEGHHSSVSDLVTLGRYAMTTFPLIASTVSLHSVTVPVGNVQVTLPSTDEFVRTYPGALGIKTGAGDYVTSFLGSARRGGVTLYACVLGCTTKEGRFTDTESLMDWAWKSYDSYQLASKSGLVRVETYALRFGQVVAVNADADVRGLVWPNGGPTTYTMTANSRGMLTGLSEPVGVCQWTQDGRIVATSSYSSGDKLVPTYTGFGLIDQIEHYTRAFAQAA